MTKHRSFWPGLTVPALLIAILGVDCNNAQCEALRDELTETKHSWAKCEQDSDCIKTVGNPGDCTGIMSCDFAVNRRFRSDAERRVASLPEETVDCMQCTSPNCVAGDLAICERTTKECLLVTDILDGGTEEDGGEGGETGDAGG